MGVAQDQGTTARCQDVLDSGSFFRVRLARYNCAWFEASPARCRIGAEGAAASSYCCVCGGGYKYEYKSVGIGECMTPNGGPRGNHCYDGPSFNAGTKRTKDMCQEECEKIGDCSAYEWGRNNHYNCALYIHTRTAMPQELSSREWICNFWSAGAAGVNEVTRAHSFGHSGECFVKRWGLLG